MLAVVAAAQLAAWSGRCKPSPATHTTHQRAAERLAAQRVQQLLQQRGLQLARQLLRAAAGLRARQAQLQRTAGEAQLAAAAAAERSCAEVVQVAQLLAERLHVVRQQRLAQLPRLCRRRQLLRCAVDEMLRGRHATVHLSVTPGSCTHLREPLHRSVQRRARHLLP